MKFRFKKKPSNMETTSVEVQKSSFFDGFFTSLFTLLLSNENKFPFVFVFLISFLLCLFGAPLQIPPLIIVLFLPAYLYFNKILENDIFTSTVFSIPFSIAFNSILFRIALLFSPITTSGLFFIAVGWGMLFALSYFFRKKFSSVNLILESDPIKKAKLMFGFLFWSAFALISYYFIFSPISTQRIFWGAHDANLQLVIVDYIAHGIAQIPPYMCGGVSGFDIDSYTSTLSLMPVSLVGFFLGSSSSVAQQVLLYLGFMLTAQGIHLLFSKLFGSENAFFSPLFVVLPLSTILYFGDFVGFWRVSLFNSFLPWALLFGFFWFDEKSAILIRTVLLLFTIYLQPFEALLLVPSYLGNLLANFNQKILFQYIVIGLLVSIIGYFIFYQITFHSIDSLENKKSNFSISLSNVEKLEYNYSLLASHLLPSIRNFGIPVALVVIISLLIFYLNLNSLSGSVHRFMLLTCVVGLILSLGIINVSESLSQYVLKIRYPLLFVLFLPLFSTMLFELKKSHSVISLVILFLFVVLGLFNFSSFDSNRNLNSDYRLGVYNWLLTHNTTNKSLLTFESLVGQSSFTQLGIRMMYFDQNSFDSLNSSSLMRTDQVMLCNYRRYGLFDVRFDPLVQSPHYPDYILSSSDQSVSMLNRFFEYNSYYLVYSDNYFVLYKNRFD